QIPHGLKWTVPWLKTKINSTQQLFIDRNSSVVDHPLKPAAPHLAT
ncbi:hypothetical protein Csa_023724, partial [Cucumis sativus]